METLKNWFNGIFNSVGTKTCFVAGLFIGIIIGNLLPKP